MSDTTFLMYLLVFKSPTEEQIEKIRAVFSDFDWNMGFAVEEVVANDIFKDRLVIQFVSSKTFVSREENSDELTLFPETVEAVLTGKGQFFGCLRTASIGIEKLESYFGFLGIASEERNPDEEIIYKVTYGKYSTLEKVNLSLEQLIND